MTTNREKYLAKIDAEERAVRKELAKQRHALKVYKRYLHYALLEDMVIVYSKWIADTKQVIKVLKKSLPAPLRKEHEKISPHIIYTLSYCPTCGMEVSLHDIYCNVCGQIFR